MGILTDIWDGVRTTLIGLKITIPYIKRKPVTLMYPHERLELPDRARNRLYVNMDDCIGCDQCSRACPVNCIVIETVKAVEGDSPGITSNGKKKALWVTTFDIDIAKCCYCGLCVYPCPTECIKMTDVFEFAEQERDNLIYNYVTLTPEEIAQKGAMASADAAATAAPKKAAAGAPKPVAAAAAAVAAAPAGPLSDADKAAKIAELQAKMAAAKARRESGETAPNEPAPAAKEASAEAPAAAAASATAVPAEAAAVAAQPVAEAASAEDDPEKAAKIAAMKEKIAAAKRERGL